MREIYPADPAKGWRPWGVLVPFLGVFFVLATLAPAQIFLTRIHLADTHGDPAGFWGLAAFLLLSFSGLALAVLAWTRLVERRSFASLGLRAHRAVPRFAAGLASGVLMVLAIVAGTWLAGGLVAQERASAFASPAALAGIALLLAAFAVQSSAEEILFRGWMLSALAVKFGVTTAVLVSSAVFALLHFEPGAPPLFVFNIVLFALFAASWSLRAGQIWSAMGWHSAWNWLHGTGFGLRITGLDTHMPPLLVHLVPQGPIWLTGGAQGLEGSVMCSAVLAVGILFNLVGIWRRGLAAVVHI